MNAISAKAASAVVATGALLILPACNVPPPPDDQPLLEWVVNSVEFSTDADSWFQNPKLNEKIENIRKATNEAFGQVARINFDYVGPITVGLSSAPLSAWPSIDANDTQLYDPTGSGERFYATYLQDHRSENYAFGVFWILGPGTSFDICGTQAKALGFNVDGTQFDDNEVPTQVKSRGIFVFAGWIYAVTQCSWYTQAGWPAINLYIRVHVHEMGHQRGDLTHSDQHTNFHTGPIPTINTAQNNGYDVMHSNALTNDLRKTVPIFDQHFEPATEPTVCIHLTCQDNLACWRSIRN